MKRNIIAKSARTPDSRLREQMLPFSLLAAAQPQVEQLKSGCSAWSRMTILLTPPPPLCFIPHRSLNNPDKKCVMSHPSPCQFPLMPSHSSKNQTQTPKSNMLARCSPDDLLSKLIWSAIQGWPTRSQVKWGTLLSFSKSISCHPSMSLLTCLNSCHLVHQSTSHSLLRPWHLMFPIL